jgi:hypothetical protein
VNLQQTDVRFDRSTWVSRGETHREAFLRATPFPHVVLDDVLPPDVLNRVIDEFPSSDNACWQRFDRQSEIKLALADTTRMGPTTRQLLAEFNGQVFVEFLEALTAIDHLVPDPHYEGGGLHQIRRGGLLKVHADFNISQRLQLDRRLNALLYLNPDWSEDYGGHLELWDESMNRPVERIAPVFNRMVVFATTDGALHGHPEPLRCPPERARRSLALYYYTNGRPARERSAEHTTLFRARPGERIQRSWRSQARRWVPPVIADIGRRRRGRTVNS